MGKRKRGSSIEGSGALNSFFAEIEKMNSDYPSDSTLKAFDIDDWRKELWQFNDGKIKEVPKGLYLRLTNFDQGRSGFFLGILPDKMSKRVVECVNGCLMIPNPEFSIPRTVELLKRIGGQNVNSVRSVGSFIDGATAYVANRVLRELEVE